MADYLRDYLIPFPSSNGRGCRRRELSYGTMSAMQNRVLRMVKLCEVSLFPRPHGSGRRTQTGLSCPEQPRCLGFEKSVRDFLGGLVSSSQRAIRMHCRSKESGTYSAQLSQNCRKDCPDPLAEAETLAQLDEFFSGQGVPEEERSRCSKLLEGGVRTDVPRAPDELTRQGRRASSFSSTEFPKKSRYRCCRNLNTRVARAGSCV